MNKKIISGLFSFAVVALLTGCGGSNGGKGQGNGNGQGNGQGNGGKSSDENCTLIDVNSYPMSNLSQPLKDAIAYMGNEERLAYDVYQNLYKYHMDESNTEIKQMKNISEKSEVKHIQIVQDIVRKYSLGSATVTNVESGVADSSVTLENMPSGKYDVPSIQALYDALYAKGVESKQAALEAACMVEVTDVDDLDKYIDIAKEDNAQDVIDAFDFLRKGSYNHYWAFDKGLTKMGISDGCCSLGTIDGVNYCHSEYPQKEK